MEQNESLQFHKLQPHKNGTILKTYPMPNRIVIYEPLEWTGHRPNFVTTIASTLVELGHEVFVLCDDPRDAKRRIGSRENVHVSANEEFKLRPTFTQRLSNRIFAFGSSFSGFQSHAEAHLSDRFAEARLSTLKNYWDENSFDDETIGLITNLKSIELRKSNRDLLTLLPNKWVALDYQLSPEARDWHQRLDRLRNIFQWRPALSILTLSEEVAENSEFKKLGVNASLLPDFTDLQRLHAPPPNWERIRVEDSELRIVGMAGRLTRRRGFSLFLESAARNQEEKVQFVAVGSVEESDLSPGELRQLSRIRSHHCANTTLIETSLRDDEFNEWMARFDVAFLCYPGFHGSSNQLTKASCFGTSVIVGPTGVMARRVSSFGIGEVCELSPESVLSAVAQLLKRGIPRSNFQRFNEHHSVDRLKCVLNATFPAGPN